MSELKYVPTKPKANVCQNGYTILCNARKTSKSFLKHFSTIQGSRRGAPTDVRQDLLRAMLTFASSGLDALVKQLVRDTLPSIIDNNEGASNMFSNTFVERRLKMGEGINHRLLAKIISHSNPRSHLIG